MVTWYWIENSISQECNGIHSIALFASAIVLYVLFHCTLCVFDKSHPSKCFSYESISLFWYYIKQIMNVYSCNGKNIFIRWKMECSMTAIALIDIHYLYNVICNTTFNSLFKVHGHSDTFFHCKFKRKFSASELFWIHGAETEIRTYIHQCTLSSIGGNWQLRLWILYIY
jgi:hypothetical protein